MVQARICAMVWLYGLWYRPGYVPWFGCTGYGAGQDMCHGLVVRAMVQARICAMVLVVWAMVQARICAMVFVVWAMVQARICAMVLVV